MSTPARHTAADGRRAGVPEPMPGDGGPVITATIPLPPAVNNLYANARSGRIKSRAYRAWIREAGTILSLACQAKRIDGPYSLALRIGKPDNRKRDLGNLEKPISDLLVAMNVVRDDSDCQRLAMEWSSEFPDVFVMVVPTMAVPPFAKAREARAA